MKKISLFITSLALIMIFLVGCSSTSNKSLSKSTQNSAATKISTVDYQNLSQSDKKNILFKFSQVKDETKANPVYIISMKITNNTKKVIRFDKSKFMVFVDSNTKFNSTKKGIIKVKPHQNVSINQIIDNVSEQAIVSDNSYFVYLNNNNKLAKTLTVTPKIKKTNDNTENQNTANDTTNTDTSSTNTNSNDSDDSGNQQEQAANSQTQNNAFDSNGNPQINPNDGDGGIFDRISVWQDQAKQDALNQGMSDDEANDYAYKIAWQKENAFESGL